MHKDASTPIVLAEMKEIWVEVRKRWDEVQKGKVIIFPFCSREIRN